MDSPACITWTSPAATAFFAGLDLNFSATAPGVALPPASMQSTSQHDTHLSAQHTVATVAGESASLFTHAGGIQAIAANGPLSLQAHLGTLDILADDSLTITSVNGHIDIKAKDKIVLYCDGAAITLEGPNITLSGNEITVKALIHGFGGPGQGAFNVENLPDGTVRAVNFGAPHEITQMAGAIPWLAYAEDNIEEHEIFYEIVDAKTESPIETMTYKLTSGSKTANRWAKNEWW